MDRKDKIVQILTAILAGIAAVLGVLRQSTTPMTPGSPVPPSIQDTLPSEPPPLTREQLEEKWSSAIGKIQFGSAGCTGTLIGKPDKDGRTYVLSASHCHRGQPKHGKMLLRDGRTIQLEFLRDDPKADVAWLKTVHAETELPYLELADDLPKPGTKIWHSGFGTHIPGNRETGEVVSAENADGQTEMILNVSSGDSGGAIALDDNGRVISCVCCTAARGSKSRVWGASVRSIRKLQAELVSIQFGWTPIEVPLHKEE